MATALDRRDDVLAIEAGRAAAGPLAQRSGLAANLLLLVGRVDEASDLMAADRVFWEHRGHPGTVVAPFLLIGGSGASGDKRWARLLLSTLLVDVLSGQPVGSERLAGRRPRPCRLLDRRGGRWQAPQLLPAAAESPLL